VLITFYINVPWAYLVPFPRYIGRDIGRKLLIFFNRRLFQVSVQGIVLAVL